MTRSSHKGHVESGDPHWFEWLTGGLCTALVVAMLCWIGYDILRYDPAAQAAFTVRVLSVTPLEETYRVSFEVENTSLVTAAGVHVRGDLATGGGPPESADVTFDYVASESREAGTLFFRADPRAGDLTLGVVGYTDP